MSDEGTQSPPKDEVKMTNRERAEKLYSSLQVGQYAPDVDLIERALDEAEKRGQEKMRETAAKEADKCCVVGDECGGKVPWCRACLSAMNIRALPIEE